MKRFSESRMREIRTSGSMRGERAALFVSSVLLLYRETLFLSVQLMPLELLPIVSQRRHGAKNASAFLYSSLLTTA